MSSPLRRILGSLALLGSLLLTAWGSGILYWHFKIQFAINTLKADVLSDYKSNRGGLDVLMASGCRALPYLVRALGESEDGRVLELLSHLICWESIYPGMEDHDFGSPQLDVRLESWGIDPRDPPELRRKKCALIQEWWARHGSEHHQVWRFWSSQCRPFVPGSAELP